jgi:molybdopterin molybdotransferase
MISVSRAIDIVLEQVKPQPVETVSLEHCYGRILAEDIIADSDVPPFDRSQMDGYALRAADVSNVPAKLKIVGESAAGRGWHNELKGGEAVRIMTGAPVPQGADSVQQIELTQAANGDEVEILESVSVGRSVVARGSEIKSGETVLRQGERIAAASMAVLASFGYSQAQVSKQPRVSVLATGSELVAVDQKPGQDQIRDSNNFTISTYATLAGAIVERLPLAGDDTALLKKQIQHAAEKSDVVITSGGVSVGDYDFTKPALRELGAEMFFERVALRPGKPTVFARLPGGALFFGLPGNPVSVSVTFNLFARTALLAMQSANETRLSQGCAMLTKPVKGSKERESYLPAIIETSNDDPSLSATPLKWGGSSDFVGFAKASALIIVPAESGVIEQGSIVRILRLPV